MDDSSLTIIQSDMRTLSQVHAFGEINHCFAKAESFCRERDAFDMFRPNFHFNILADGQSV